MSDYKKYESGVCANCGGSFISNHYDDGMCWTDLSIITHFEDSGLKAIHDNSLELLDAAEKVIEEKKSLTVEGGLVYDQVNARYCADADSFEQLSDSIKALRSIIDKCKSH